MKNRNLSLLIIISLVTNSFGVITPTPNSYGVIPPAPDGTKFFNESTVTATSIGQYGVSGIDVNDSSKNNIIGDDNLSKQDISQGIAYKQNLGVATGKSITNPNGSMTYVKMNPDGTYPSIDTPPTPEPDRMLDPDYITWRQQYKEYVTEENLTIKRNNENLAQERNRDMTYKYSNNVNDTTARMFHGKSPLSAAQSTTRSFRTMKEKLGADGSKSTMYELDENGSKFYKDLYSNNVGVADKENILNTNYGALAAGYQSAEAIGKQLTARLQSGKIKCQIVRKLVPSYKCPLPNKGGLIFPSPGDAVGVNNGADGTAISNPRKVNVIEAKDKCNEVCWTDPGDLSCVSKRVLNSNTISIPPKTIIVYPNWNETASTFTIDTSDQMPVDKISFSISIPNPSDSNLTNQEWESFIENSEFKVRFSILETNPINPNDPGFTISDRENINLRSSSMTIESPINRIVKQLKIKIWKPYINNNSLQAYRDAPKFNKLNNITVSNFNASYTSDSLHFCQPLQLVGQPNQCVGGKVIPFTSGDDQFNFICLSGSKRIGPDSVFGGFYSRESCEAKCIRHEECYSTYQNFSDFSEGEILKAEISCLDDEENKNCTQAKCEAFFADQEERPLNEIVVHNDDTMVYTVRNKSLTEEIRPKIDLGNEIPGGHGADYDQIFENEEKDAAYLSMLKKESFNRIKYRLGTESPFNMAYHKNPITEYKNEFVVDLKPASFDIDSGKTFKIYSVIKLAHSYVPAAGTFYLDGHNIVASETNLQFEDMAYLIKTNNSLGGWEVFRTEIWAKLFTDTTTPFINPLGDLESNRFIGWIDVPQYKRSLFGHLNITSGEFEAFDKSQIAPHFKTEEFKNNQDFYKYKISEWIESDLTDVPGTLIHDQIPINHETDIKRIYSGPFNGPNFSSIKDYTIYMLYSEQDLSYHEIMTKIEGASYESSKQEPEKNIYGVYNLYSSKLFRSDSIKYDGEINNQVKPLIMGPLNNSTVSVQFEPGLSEKGKKMFKFLFIYNESETDHFALTNADTETNPSTPASTQP